MDATVEHHTLALVSKHEARPSNLLAGSQWSNDHLIWLSFVAFWPSLHRLMCHFMVALSRLVTIR
jgi:hypothetical protein